MIDTLLAGRYRIDAQLGEGGMAVVYKAMDLVLHRIVAIKMLRAQYAGDDEFVERFRREAQAAASLSHPNVVNIFDVGEADGVHYIVLEYVQGRNLKEILRSEGRLDPRRAARIATAVARALQAAHDRGLVHRDIKPHNILITPEGRVKVTDFGIARATSSATLTEAGMVIGSVHYFSPEQARGQAVGPAADVYSLGVVLYEMLTGRAPFHGDSPVAVALKHLQQPPTPPRELVGSIPVWLEQVVLRALAKDPARRYRSAAQLAVDLAWRHAEPLDRGTEEQAGSETRLATSVGKGATKVAPAPTGRAQTGSMPRGVEPKGFDPSLAPPPDMAEEALAALAAGSEKAGEQEEGRGSARSRGWLITFVLLLAVGLGVYAGTPVILDMIFPPEVEVPSVVGVTFDEARPLAAEAGLLLKVDGEVFDRHVPEGAIVRQVPEAGRTVRRGRDLGVVLSRGPEMGTVPDVTGQQMRAARVQLTQAGFTLAAEEPVPDASAPANEVIAQEPAPGTIWEKGAAVTLWVSKPGVAIGLPVEVPDFRGRSLQEAETALADLGLGMGNVWGERHPLVPAGRIVDQNPPPGAALEPGGLVDFVYSEGLVPAADRDNAGAGFGPDADREYDPLAAEDGRGAGPPSDGPATGTPPALPPDGAGQEPPQAPEGEEPVDWDAVLKAETAEGGRRRAKVDVYIPPGAPREVVILVIDDFGVREALRRTAPGDTNVEHLVDGRGEQARLQVYVDGVMQTDQAFPDF